MTIEVSCGWTGRDRVSGEGHAGTRSGNVIHQSLAAMVPNVLADHSMINANVAHGYCVISVSDCRMVYWTLR